MIDYVAREDVLEILSRKSAPWDSDSLVRELPAADVRPVVLCRDCRHRDPEDHKCDSGQTERQGCPFKVADNYFCAYGER